MLLWVIVSWIFKVVFYRQKFDFFLTKLKPYSLNRYNRIMDRCILYITVHNFYS